MSRLAGIMAEKLSVPKENINDETAYNVAKNWDSITHLEIVASIEDEYGISLDIDEITAMENVGKIKEILIKKGVKDI